MKNILLAFLVIVAVVMIYLGIKSTMLPPVLTGIGFLIITAILFFDRPKQV